MMEEYFFKHWSERRTALPQIYLPIGWSTYFFSAARGTFNSSEVARAKFQVSTLEISQHRVSPPPREPFKNRIYSTWQLLSIWRIRPCIHLWHS